jgi:GTP-binding protein Era
MAPKTPTSSSSRSARLSRTKKEKPKREPGSTKSRGPQPKKKTPSAPSSSSSSSSSSRRGTAAKDRTKKSEAEARPSKKAATAPSSVSPAPRATSPKGRRDDGPVLIDMPPPSPAELRGQRSTGPSRPPRRRVVEGPSRCGTVALVGRPNVGKSSLLNALLGQKIAATTHKPQTTRRALRGVLTEENVQLIFVDTPGLHEEKGGLFSFMLDEALDAAADTDVLVFMVEADRKRQGIDKKDEEALARLLTKAKDTPVILVVNKIDVLEEKAVLLPLLSSWAAQGRFAGLVPLSAHKADNLDALVRELSRLVPEGPLLLPADSLTDQSERDIAAELIREKVMLELQQEIPYRTAVIVEHFDEARREDRRKPLVHIAAVIVVEKDSHKSMVIGKGGQRIKTIGQRARKDLEHLLQCQVHLELFAKVEKDWTLTGAGPHPHAQRRAARGRGHQAGAHRRVD